MRKTPQFCPHWDNRTFRGRNLRPHGGWHGPSAYGLPVTSTKNDQVISHARGMREVVRAEAAESERLRTLTDTIVDEMWSSGLMTALGPREAGGIAPSLAEVF